MPQPQFSSFRTYRVLSVALAATIILPIAVADGGQVTGNQANGATTLPATTKQPSSVKAAAYYHFSLGHLYEELAANYGNRSDYVNKAIENYRLAMKDDPSASFLVEDIAELYRVSGRIREAVDEAQDALKANPNDLNARRVLARIYTQQIGDAQADHVDEEMVKRAVEQYKFITEKDPKDADSLVMLGRLDRVLEDSVDSEAAFKKALSVDPDNEDAVTGLASVYTDRGDANGASALLEQLTKKNPTTRVFLGLASNYESLHKYAEAADAYKKAIDLDGTHPEWYLAMAQDQAAAGNYDGALKSYQAFAEGNPQDPQAYVGMTQIYREQKDFANARKMLDKAKRIDPDSLEVRYNEVGLLKDEGRTGDAIASLKLILDSTTKRTYTPAEKAYRERMTEQLGLLYRESDQYDQAVEAFRQLGAADPEAGAHAEAQMIDTYRIAKEYGKAQQESDAAAKKYPADRTLHEVRAQLLADEGKTEPAIAELKKLLDGKNDLETYLAIADVYQKARNYGGAGNALDSADKLAKSKDERENVWFVRGSLYERQKKYDQAEKAFREVLSSGSPKDPLYASTLNYLGYMLADQNVRLTEAQDFVKQAVALDPNNYAFLDSLGWVYYHLDRLDDAAQQLTRSLQLSSKDPTIHDHLGDVYFKQGKIKEAITEWQTSLKSWSVGAAADQEPDDIAKVQKKLDNARVKLAKEQSPKQSDQ